MARIRVVEDEKSISDLIAMNLSLVGHTTDQVAAGKAARRCLEDYTYHLVILDIMLPEMDGFGLLRYVPDGTPVIFVTARNNLCDRVRGLNLGADDYIVKPFETVELLARIEAVLRRTHRASSVFALDGTVVNLDSRVVTVGGRVVALTLREYALLEILIRHQNIALSREKLLELAWGYDYAGETRTVDVHIQKLRSWVGSGGSRRFTNWDTVLRSIYEVLAKSVLGHPGRLCRVNQCVLVPDFSVQFLAERPPGNQPGAGRISRHCRQH